MSHSDLLTHAACEETLTCGLGLIHRMKLHLVEPSSVVSSLIDDTKPEDTVGRFVRLARPSLAAAAGSYPPTNTSPM